jgi:TRAP-type transport system small permease protein
MSMRFSPMRKLYARHCHLDSASAALDAAINCIYGELLSIIVSKRPVLIRSCLALVDWSAIVMGAAIVTLVFTNVVLHVVNLDMAWTTELCELLMVWVTFIGGAAAAARGEHVAITELIDFLSRRPRQWADAIAQIVVAFVLCLLIWYGIEIARSSWNNHLPVLDWPVSVEYIALPVGSAATLVFVLYDIVQIARNVPRAQRYCE